jgi:GH35 family endo-1,4-beta-xylanase
MMSHARTILLCAGLAAFACAAHADDSGPIALLPPDSAFAFRLSDAAGEFAKLSVATVSGQPFQSALRLEVSKKPARSQDVQISAPLTAAVTSGSVLMISFWMRSANSGEATVDAGLRATGPARGPAPLNMPAAAGSVWKRIQLPFASTQGYDKEDAEVFLTLGLREQTVEIGGIELLNYGTSRRVADLPFTRLGYAGSEPTAAWRKAAEERIERNRKGNLTILVKDKANKPVRGAEVSIRMRKHAFLFGTAVNATAFSSQRMSAENLARYKQEIVQLFNFAVMENEMKWPQWSNEASRPATVAVVDWLRESGLQVRGHNLVWPSWRNTNVKSAMDAKDDPTALAKVITSHIAETTAAFRGRLVDWDVINETFTNHDFMDILGRRAMVDWFQAARAGDPAVKLYINDFNIIEGNDQAHQDDYAATIRYLIDEGAPIEGIGLQSHFPARVTPMDDLMKRFDRFAAFGKELEITEFDINTADEVTQAFYTRDFMTLAFSLPSVKAFLLWGFWEGAHWIPRGAMMRRDWSLKPNGEVYKDLVFKRWWTNADGKTGAQGTFATRGFLGDYEIEVKAGRKTKTVRVTLPKEGARAECVLDGNANE